nr:hypothetical protein [Nitrosomonas nitrosa]
MLVEARKKRGQVGGMAPVARGRGDPTRLAFCEVDTVVGRHPWITHAVAAAQSNRPVDVEKEGAHEDHHAFLQEDFTHLADTPRVLRVVEVSEPQVSAKPLAEGAAVQQNCTAAEIARLPFPGWGRVDLPNPDDWVNERPTLQSTVCSAWRSSLTVPWWQTTPGALFSVIFPCPTRPYVPRPARRKGCIPTRHLASRHIAVAAGAGPHYLLRPANPRFRPSERRTPPSCA